MATVNATAWVRECNAALRGRTAVEVARQTEAKVETEWTAHLGEEAAGCGSAPAQPPETGD